jgi:O-acetylhomoserine (thiol)-lyase
MAAIAAAVLSVAGSGDNIVASKYLFGDTFSFFRDTLGGLGVEVRFADPLAPDSFEELIDENTRAIYLETLTNPLLYVADMDVFSVIAKKHGIILAVDTTMTPPYLFDSKKHGVDMELISATKAMTGGATVMAGLIIDNGSYDWSKNRLLKDFAKKFGPFALISKIRRQTARFLGGCPAPHNAYLLSLGIETLALRMDRACANALAVSRYLEARPEVTRVLYPGLESSAFRALAGSLFPRLPGCVISFELSGREECFTFINALKVIRRSTNLHDNKSLCLHAASTLFVHLSEEERREAGISQALIRLTVGIEEAEDIMDDIDQALGSLRNGGWKTKKGIALWNTTKTTSRDTADT